jgi:hypothetical protein
MSSLQYVSIGSDSADANFDLTCPNGTYLTDIYGRHDHFINRVGIKCSDGTTLSEVGGIKEGAEFQVSCADGIHEIKLKAGPFVNQLGTHCSNQLLEVGTPGGHINSEINCGNQTLYGIYGRAGDHVNSIGVKCRNKGSKSTRRVAPNIKVTSHVTQVTGNTKQEAEMTKQEAEMTINYSKYVEILLICLILLFSASYLIKYFKME